MCSTRQAGISSWAARSRRGWQRQEGLLVHTAPESILINMVVVGQHRQIGGSYRRLYCLQAAAVFAPQAGVAVEPMLTSGMASALGLKCIHIQVRFRSGTGYRLIRG